MPYSCHSNGSLTLILMPISRHSQNILRSPSHAASLTVWSTPPAASKARVSLVGNVTVLEASSVVADPGIKDCYLKRHPDAKWWLPEDPDAPHTVRGLFSLIPLATVLSLFSDASGTQASWARFDPHVSSSHELLGTSHESCNGVLIIMFLVSERLFCRRIWRVSVFAIAAAFVFVIFVLLYYYLLIISTANTTSAPFLWSFIETRRALYHISHPCSSLWKPDLRMELVTFVSVQERITSARYNSVCNKYNVDMINVHRIPSTLRISS